MLNLGSLSYALAAVAYLALALMLFTRWRREFHGSLLLPAALVGVVWSVALAWQLAGTAPPLSGLFFFLEILRVAMWLAVLMRVLAGLEEKPLPRWVRGFVYLSVACILLAGLALGVMHDLGIVIDSARRMLIPAMLLLALIGFVLVEQVYRNTRASEEWSVKFMWIGTGALFAYDLCLYSIALLFNEILLPMWEARGAANALVIPLIAIGVARTARWAPGTFMSRRPAFYTTSILVAGSYLLVVAVAGYYVRIFGGTWGGAAQVLFLFGAGLLLLLVLFSGQARAWLRVFLTKHFYPYKYDYRVEWLRLIRTLSSTGDATLAQRTVQALAQIVNSSGGGIWVADDEGVFVPSGGDLAGPDSPAEPAGSAFTRFIAEREWIANINARRARSAVDCADLPIPEWLFKLERAWLVVPLLQDERLVAFVAVAQPLTPHELIWEDIDLLRTVGRQAASYIALDHAARRLAQSQQFEAYNRFAAFMMHDLKNLIAQQTLVVQNAARHRDKPAFIDDAISTIDNSVKRMNRLLEQLRRGESLGVARRVRLAQVCADTASRCADRHPAPVFGNGTNEGRDEELEVLVSAERLSVVLEHVIRNAQDATAPDGRVEIELRRAARHAIIEVRDTGRGMDAAFIRERLFRPFDTTKGSQGMGIGAFQTREFVRMAGGDVHVESDLGKGTRFVISLPLVAMS
jgi:putative PEP-CTERM system histidine kinase